MCGENGRQMRSDRGHVVPTVVNWPVEVVNPRGRSGRRDVASSRWDCPAGHWRRILQAMAMFRGCSGDVRTPRPGTGGAAGWEWRCQIAKYPRYEMTVRACG